MLKNAFKKYPPQNRTNVQIKGGGGGGSKAFWTMFKKTSLFPRDGFPNQSNQDFRMRPCGSEGSCHIKPPWFYGEWKYHLRPCWFIMMMYMIWEKRRHLHQVVCHPGQRSAYWGLGDTPLSSFSSNSNPYIIIQHHSLVKTLAFDLVIYILGNYPNVHWWYCFWINWWCRRLGDPNSFQYLGCLHWRPEANPVWAFPSDFHFIRISITCRLLIFRKFGRNINSSTKP